MPYCYLEPLDQTSAELEQSWWLRKIYTDADAIAAAEQASTAAAVVTLLADRLRVCIIVFATPSAMCRKALYVRANNSQACGMSPDS